MEQNKERSFVCKFCRKRFPCGKSLGGHIRTHTYENSVDSDEDETNKLKIGDNGGLSSYGLRENPKKNKRFVDQSEINALKHQQLLLCRECGKGFNSLKALCGHMACHSDREKMVMDSQSDTETSSAPIRRRSKRMMTHQKGLAFGSTNQSNSASFANGNSSSLSEIEQEQEELAMCLMMLSRDSTFKKGHNLVVNSMAESSDNNSVIVETKSSSGELKIMNVQNFEGFCYNADEIVNIKKQGNDKELRSTKINDVLLYDSDNSDSGYFRNGPKKVESDVFVDGFLGSSGFSKATMEYGSRFNDLQTKQSKNKFKNAIESGRASTKYDLRKSKRVCSYNPQKNSKKYDLKTKNEFAESVYDSGENSLEADSCANTKQNIPNSNKLSQPSSSSKHTTASAAYKKAGAKKKNKGHECPICFRVFKSGQALGGHKRSHFIGNQDNSTVVIQQDVTEMHTLIDLNLPAPVDE